jgi:branched-chain amino acid transport system substrate-binding protein
MKKALLLAGALVAALAGLSSATAAPERATAPSATPGVTSKNIVIGGTFPLSGPASLYAPIPRGMAAYFSYINSRRSKVDGKRGVYGRQIVWKFYDDQYNPSQTVQLTNRLILQDKVFSIVGSLGTEHNQAIRPLLNSRKIPQVFVSTGASFWGTQRKEFPYTVGWQPDYVSEGKVYGRWITQNAPNAKIAVFYQNDDYGKDYLNGLKQGLGSRQNLIVSEQSYEVTDASYASQIARQRASGADTWVLLTTPTPTVRAIGTARALNFRPSQIIINSVAATDGVMRAAVNSAGAAYVNGAVSTGYLKNPTNPKYRKDGAVRQYNQLMTKYGPSGANRADTFYYYGFAKGYDVVKLLYAAGKNPTRESLMRATQAMNWVNPYMIKGVVSKTTKSDNFPLDQIKIVRYNVPPGSWTEASSLYKGR